MQKNALLAVIAISGLAFASCSSDEPVVGPAGGDGTVTFVAQLPSTLQSRAFGDGEKALALTYAVYETGSTDAVITSADPNAPQATFSGLQTTLSLNLVKGKTYDFVFWADVPGNSVYTFDAASQSISVDYDGVLSNDENRDAFFRCEKALAVNGPVQKTITLFRPFAQINVGTSDLAVAAAAGTVVENTSMLVKGGVYSTLNLMTGVASDEVAGGLLFDLAELPQGEVFPVRGYDYLSMNYILTGTEVGEDGVAQKELVDCEFVITETGGKVINTLQLPNVPVQRNWRTNIYGALLTSPLDFTIEINPDFETPDHVYSQLLLAAQNGGTVVLSDDVDLEGQSLVIAEGKEMILDLNGKTMTNTTLEAWGNLVLRGEGTVVATPAEAGKVNQPAVWGRPGASVTIEGGTYIGSAIPGETDINLNPSTIYAQGSRNMEDGSVLQKDVTITIKGGYFEAPENVRLLNEQDNEFSHIVVTGGTFVGQDPSKGDDHNGINFVPAGFASLGVETDGKMVYTVSASHDVDNVEDVKTVLAQGGSAVLNVTEDITLDENDRYINIPEGSTLVVRGTKGRATNVITAEEYLFVVRGGKIDIEGVELRTRSNTNGAAVYLFDNSEAILNDVVIDAGFACIEANKVANFNVVANNCHITSASSNKYGKWSYGIILSGENGVGEFNNCTVRGVQGGLSAGNGAVVTINGGDYATENSEPGREDAFYAVYVSNSGKAIITDGKFYSPRKAVYSGNNDIESYGFGCLEMRGGMYSSISWDQQTGSEYPLPDGYVWQETGDERYPLQVVKK